MSARKRAFGSQEAFREFIRITAGLPPWPALVRGVELLGHSGDALDVGCGAGRDTAYLLQQDFKVTAIDSSAAAAGAMRRMPRQRWLCFQQIGAEKFEPEHYDLINAQYVLPFVPRNRFRATVRRLVAALNPGGIMTVVFFGPRDEWNVPGSKVNFTARDSVPGLLTGLDIVELEEEDKDGQTADGTPKHWHIFHVMARRPAPA